MAKGQARWKWRSLWQPSKTRTRLKRSRSKVSKRSAQMLFLPSSVGAWTRWSPLGKGNLLWRKPIQEWAAAGAGAKRAERSWPKLCPRGGWRWRGPQLHFRLTALQLGGEYLVSSDQIALVDLALRINGFSKGGSIQGYRWHTSESLVWPTLRKILGCLP